MKDQDFPEWTPRFLLDKILSFDPVSQVQKKTTSAPDLIAEIYIKLASHPAMESVWRKLKKHGGGNQVAKSYIELDIELFSGSVIVALTSRSTWEDLTPKARERELDNIINQFKTLSKKVEIYDIGRSILSDLEPKELVGISELLDYVFQPEIEKSDKEKNIHRIDLINVAPQRNVPSLPDLLNRYVEKLQISPPYKETVLQRPKRKDSDLTFFIRKMAEHTNRWYKQPLHSIIADTASVFFPSKTITPDTVRFVLNPKSKN